ncbi:MAG: DUF368 domain-containing protein [Candidatus Delongbacteria bacterium]
MKKYISVLLKGIGVGIANIIPGVSGGTIALITGIFEETVNSIKSFDVGAIKLLIKGKFPEFVKHTNLYFLFSLLAGASAGIFLLSFVLEFLFEYYPEFVWAFFFGLILSSVVFVAKRICKWNFFLIIYFLFGTLTAVTVTNILEPASENPSFTYVFICGAVAVCSMILPGLSGSFVLILMGNYELIMIRSVKNLDMQILTPLFLGAGFGIIAFSHLLSWVFKKFPDQTIAVLTGFILGSLPLVWPWKKEVTEIFGADKVKIVGYNYYFPQSFSIEELLTVLFMITGFAVLYFLEKNTSLDHSPDET